MVDFGLPNTEKVSQQCVAVFGVPKQGEDSDFFVNQSLTFSLNSMFVFFPR